MVFLFKLQLTRVRNEWRARGMVIVTALWEREREDYY